MMDKSSGRGSWAAIAGAVVLLAPVVMDYLEARATGIRAESQAAEALAFRDQATPLLQQPFTGTQVLLLINQVCYDNGLEPPDPSDFREILRMGPQGLEQPDTKKDDE